MLEALTELRILTSADRVRLNHHQTTLEKCRALGLCPKSPRIRSYNVPNLMPSAKVIAELDALVHTTEMKKLDIFIAHYREIYENYEVLIDKISARNAKITANSPELQDCLTKIDRLKNVSLSELRERERKLVRLATRIETLAREATKALKKAQDRDQKRQFRQSILGVLYHSPTTIIIRIHFFVVGDLYSRHVRDSEITAPKRSRGQLSRWPEGGGSINPTLPEF